MAKCRNCGKDIPENLDFCSEECMKAYKGKNKAEAVEEKSDLDVEIENTLLDPAYMRGLSWRKAKLEAVYKARLKGYSDEWIINMLMRGGLTRLTAKKIMDDSRAVYGG
jgi:hypothetical protein